MLILEQLHKDWDLLLAKLAEKGVKLQQALVLVQFLRQCDEVMFWINDKVSFKLLLKVSVSIIFTVILRKLLLPLMNLVLIWNMWKYCNVSLMNFKRI